MICAWDALFCATMQIGGHDFLMGNEQPVPYAAIAAACHSHRLTLTGVETSPLAFWGGTRISVSPHRCAGRRGHCAMPSLLSVPLWTGQMLPR